MCTFVPFLFSMFRGNKNKCISHASIQCKYLCTILFPTLVEYFPVIGFCYSFNGLCYLFTYLIGFMNLKFIFLLTFDVHSLQFVTFRIHRFFFFLELKTFFILCIHTNFDLLMTVHVQFGS